MELIVNKVGRIEHAEIEIRPLTVFVGENGTNKTWTAHGLFKILERLRLHVRQRTRPGAFDANLLRVLETRAVSLVRRAKTTWGEARFEVTRDELVSELPAELTFSLAHPEWDSALGFTPNTDARLTLSLKREEFARGVASRLEIGLSLDPFHLVTDLFVEGLVEPIRATDFGGSRGSKSAVANVRAALEDLLFAWKRRVRVMPVEREHLAQVFSWLLSQDVQIPMPRALVDFCYMMNEARGRSETDLPNTDLRTAVHQILGGRFRFADRTRELRFEPSVPGVGSIPIKASASLGKSLVGLDIFLASSLPGDILLIDEPEMNAHPAAQVALVDLFALMIRAGMQVLIVTHSPYVLDHLGTLVEASRIQGDARARITRKLRFGSSEALLEPEQLAVYRFGLDGNVTSIFDRETRAIDPSVFSDVGDAEMNLFGDVLAAERPRGD